jgi:hypothetical protein
MRKLAVILISLVTALTGVAPAQAFPSVAAPKVQSQAADVQTVQYNGHPRWSRHNRHWRGDRGRHWHHGRHWRDDRRYSHRRYHRHRNNNAGAIIGGLAAGAIIGGAIASSQPRQYRSVGNDHVSWCYSRYRSYRASDNTFQPYNGPRRQCYSPY